MSSIKSSYGTERFAKIIPSAPSTKGINLASISTFSLIYLDRSWYLCIFACSTFLFQGSAMSSGIWLFLCTTGQFRPVVSQNGRITSLVRFRLLTVVNARTISLCISEITFCTVPKCILGYTLSWSRQFSSCVNWMQLPPVVLQSVPTEPAHG